MAAQLEQPRFDVEGTAVPVLAVVAEQNRFLQYVDRAGMQTRVLVGFA